jgi:hypothetical protein
MVYNTAPPQQSPSRLHHSDSPIQPNQVNKKFKISKGALDPIVHVTKKYETFLYEEIIEKMEHEI